MDATTYLSLMEFINFQTGREGKARLYQDNATAIDYTKMENHLTKQGT
jgi:hypothetical protein